MMEPNMTATEVLASGKRAVRRMKPLRYDSTGAAYWPIGKTLRLYPWVREDGGRIVADLVSTMDCDRFELYLVAEDIFVHEPKTDAERLVVSLVTAAGFAAVLGPYHSWKEE